MDANISTSRISIRQAATMLDITPQTLKRALVATGRLRMIEITPRKRYVFLADVEQLLNPFPQAGCDGA